MKKNRKYILLIILIIVSMGGFIYSSINVFTAMKTVDQVMRLVRDYYVNPVETEQLLDYAIEAIAESLDVHTTYLKEQDFENLMIHTKGEFGGLGIQISKRGDYITIMTPLEGTPAYRQGLMQGDKIIEIEGKSTKDMKLNTAVSIMRGEPGTKVNIRISREGTEEPIDYTITRDIIKIKSVPYAGLLDDKIGYIRLNSFNKKTSTEVKNALDSLINTGAKKFVLDLRGNPGGVLQEAVETAELFIEKGKEIVYTEGKAFHESYSSKGGGYKSYPIVVLVDNFSASGSEILAGAIQDWDRGLLMGTRTFGKGSVQRLYELHNGKALKLTIARYHTPSGRCIDRELISDTTKVYHTRGPLHREVKGGGGIIPDSILPYEELSDLAKKILNRNILFNFIVSYTSEHPDVKSVNSKILNALKEKVGEEEIEFTEEEWEDALNDITEELEIRLSYNKLGNRGRYEALIPGDKHINTSIDILRNVNTPSDFFALKQL